MSHAPPGSESVALDPRLNAVRPDLADERLRGKVEANRFAPGEPGEIIAPVADLQESEARSSALASQLLLGARVKVFERKGERVWLQAERDSYVGWSDASLVGLPGPEATHVVAAARSFAYESPDIKSPAVQVLSMGCEIAIVERIETSNGTLGVDRKGNAVFLDHLRPIGEPCADPVEQARLLLGTPYLWGGSSAFGIDCSGLVQLAMRMCERNAPRDSDMQAEALGEEMDPRTPPERLRRGDLVFWPGHVAFVEGGGNLLHASARSMRVESEPLDDALGRIAKRFGEPTALRRS